MSTSKPLALPGAARQRVRAAVRAHPRCQEILAAAGREYVNSLTNAELLNACAALGIDAESIARDDTAPIAPASPIEIAETEPETAEIEEAETDTIATEVQALRRTLASAMVEGDFSAVTATLTTLITDARKPAEVITVTAPVPGAAPGATPAKPASRATWSRLFGIGGDLGKRESLVWDSPEAPTIDPLYVFPEMETASALCALARHAHPWLYGPAGTGKTTWAEQIAARLHRPFRLISCDDTTEAPELIGMRAPHDGSTVWLDGILTSAMRTAGCVILLDEPTIARAGAIMVLQNVLQNRVLFVKETGERVACAPGVVFITADNTNGTGNGAAGGYEDTRRMNRAFLDRFAVKIEMDYLSIETEVKVLQDRTGCTKELAEILVGAAHVTRVNANNGTLTAALGLRRLIAWAGQLTDGIPARFAFKSAILNGASDEDREPLEQLCALALDTNAVASALKGTYQGGSN
jgi:cobaltochelatase CobS